MNRWKAVAMGAGCLLLIAVLVGVCGGCGSGGGGNKSYRMNEADVNQIERLAQERARSEQRAKDYERMSGQKVD